MQRDLQLMITETSGQTRQQSLITYSQVAALIKLLMMIEDVGEPKTGTCKSQAYARELQSTWILLELGISHGDCEEDPWRRGKHTPERYLGPLDFK